MALAKITITSTEVDVSDAVAFGVPGNFVPLPGPAGQVMQARQYRFDAADGFVGNAPALRTLLDAAQAGGWLSMARLLMLPQGGLSSDGTGATSGRVTGIKSAAHLGAELVKADAAKQLGGGPLTGLSQPISLLRSRGGIEGGFGGTLGAGIASSDEIFAAAVLRVDSAVGNPENAVLRVGSQLTLATRTGSVRALMKSAAGAPAGSEYVAATTVGAAQVLSLYRDSSGGVLYRSSTSAAANADVSVSGRSAPIAAGAPVEVGMPPTNGGAYRYNAILLLTGADLSPVLPAVRSWLELRRAELAAS